MSVKHAILGLLAGKPLHGYELKAGFDELVPTTELNVGQVYTTLDRLSRDRLVTHEVVNQAERPDKKVYALTDDGRKELKEWLATPSALGPEPAQRDLLEADAGAAAARGRPAQGAGRGAARLLRAAARSRPRPRRGPSRKGIDATAGCSWTWRRCGSTRS